MEKMMNKFSKFRRDIESIINANSMENGSNTPDFILAEYLTSSLSAFDAAVSARERWYGRDGCEIGRLVTEQDHPCPTPTQYNEE